MAGRRGALRRRIVEGAIDLVADRAPWLTDQAYRVVATPLQWVDPTGAAQAAHGRLDGVRERFAAMARTGWVPRQEVTRMRRDLARTRDDLGRIAPRLPPVQARSLELRLAAYSEAVDALPGAGPRPGPGTGAAGRTLTLRRGRDAALLTGAAAAAWAGLLLPAAGTVAVEGGLVAGAATAAGATVARSRRARRERVEALSRALAEIDIVTAQPGGTPVGDLDRSRNALLRKAFASRRLDTRGEGALRAVDAHLDVLLVRLLADGLDTDVAFLVEATVTRYLPDTLEPFLALDDPRAQVRGRPAAVEVADQLTAIERALAQARERPSKEHPQTRLHLQGEFLRSKFGEPPA